MARAAASQQHRPWSVSASEGHTTPAGIRLAPETLHRAIETLSSLGFAVLRSPPWWADSALDAGSAAVAQSLEQLKDEYAKLNALAFSGWRLPSAPWEHLKQDPAASPRPPFRFQEGFSYTKGRLNMPLLADRSPFNAHPFRSNPDLTAMCGALYGGVRCNQTTTGTLWNFAGANSTYWHRDYPDDWQLLTVVTALHDIPVDAGWLQIQRETHATGAWSSVVGALPPRDCCHEPPGETTVLRRGDTLVFTSTTKHAVMPNPTSFERVLLYSIYAVEGRKDTWNMPDGAPSMRALLARAHAGTLTPSLNPRRLALWSTPSILKRYREVLIEGCGRCPLVDSNVSYTRLL